MRCCLLGAISQFVESNICTGNTYQPVVHTSQFHGAYDTSKQADAPTNTMRSSVPAHAYTDVVAMGMSMFEAEAQSTLSPIVCAENSWYGELLLSPTDLILSWNGMDCASLVVASHDSCSHVSPGLGNARHRQRRLATSRHLRVEAPLTSKGIDNTPALITVTKAGVLVRSGVLA